MTDLPSSSPFNRIGDANTRFQEAHEAADTDTSAEAIHHKLGTGPYQAAPGNILGDLFSQLQTWADQSIGETKLSIVNEVPQHFLPFMGQVLSKTTYPKLWAYLEGKTPNYSISSTEFRLPDARHRFIMGANGDVGTTDVNGLALRDSINQHIHVHNNVLFTSGSQVTGGPSATIDRATGAGTAAHPGHTHTIVGHSHIFDNVQATLGHAYIYLNLIIRYESGLDLGEL